MYPDHFDMTQNQLFRDSSSPTIGNGRSEQCALAWGRWRIDILKFLSKALGAPLKVSIGHTLQNRHLHIMLWNMEMQNTTVHGRRMGTVVDDPEYWLHLSGWTTWLHLDFAVDSTFGMWVLVEIWNSDLHLTLCSARLKWWGRKPQLTLPRSLVLSAWHPLCALKKSSCLLVRSSQQKLVYLHIIWGFARILLSVSKYGWWFGTFVIFHILGIIIPSDFHIFRGVGIPPTSKICFFLFQS